MTEKIYSIEEIKLILENILRDTVVKKAILFGSYAKNESTSKSDIDILVDSDGMLHGLSFFSLMELIKETFDKDVDIIEKSELIKNSKIDKEIEDTGVIVYEK